MPLFTSTRERRLWLLVLMVVAAIYITLGLAGRLAAMLREHNLLNVLFAIGFFLALTTIIGSGLVRHPKWYEIWMGLGVAVVYGMVMVRLFVTPEERTHLFEYGIVAVLIYQALRERQRNGRQVLSPPVLTIVLTTLLGWFDEGIQFLLPGRIYDIRDVGFNTLAGLIAVAANLVLVWARRRWE